MFTNETANGAWWRHNRYRLVVKDEAWHGMTVWLGTIVATIVAIVACQEGRLSVFQSVCQSVSWI